MQVILLKGLDNPVVKAYHSFQVDMAVLYGADRERAEKDMKEAFEFETALANVSLQRFFKSILSKFFFPRFLCEWRKDEMLRLCTTPSPSKSYRRNSLIIIG